MRSRSDDGLRYAWSHHGHTAAIVVVALHVAGEILAAAHQEIDDVVAHAVVKRVLVEVGSHAVLGQRVLDDLGQHGVGPVGHQQHAVGQVDRLVDVVGDHEHGLPGLQAN